MSVAGRTVTFEDVAIIAIVALAVVAIVYLRSRQP